MRAWLGPVSSLLCTETDLALLFYRQNQELERYSASMLEDKLRLQQEADMLTQRLEAVLHDKFERKSFDADTPIDKTLAYLQCVIRVCRHSKLRYAAQ